MRRPVYLKFNDTRGKTITRSTMDDFSTLPSRHLEVINNLPGFKEDADLNNLMIKALDNYERGEYNEALIDLNKCLEKMPQLEPYIFYYIRVCERVLSFPSTYNDRIYEEKLNTYKSRVKSLPKWLLWTVPEIEWLVRCKWCGQYTKYINPDIPTFGFSSDNSCSNCSAMYPMPSWMWDSPDGRAYSYYRMSFSPENKQFYKEFLKDYDPHPTVEKSGLFKK